MFIFAFLVLLVMKLTAVAPLSWLTAMIPLGAGLVYYVGVGILATLLDR